MNTKIQELLYDWGVQPHLRGFDYLEAAVELAAEDRQKIYQITTVLYPAIAKIYNTLPTRVERAIRHAIAIALNNMYPDDIYKHFGNTVRPNGSVPNSMFIAALVHAYKHMEGVNG